MEWVYAFAAVFAAHLVRGVTGFGATLVAMPVLAWVFGPAPAIFLCAALSLAGGALLVPSVWHGVRLPLVASVFLPMVLGQYLGTELLLALPVATLEVIIGLMVVLFGLDLAYRPLRPGRGELTDLPVDRGRLLAVGGAAGLIGGFMEGLVGPGGPPIVLYMKHYFQDAFFRAQLIAIFVLSSLTMLPMLWLKGATPPDTLFVAALLLIPMALGTFVGKQLAGRVPPVTFGRLVGGLLIGSGSALALF